MSIWQYSHSHDYSIQRAPATQDNCMYCETVMLRDREEEEEAALHDFMNYGMSDNFRTDSWANIAVCP